MLYPIAIESGNESEAYSVYFPDVAGCYSAGDSFEEALINSKEALQLHFELLAEQTELPPVASSINTHQTNPDYADCVWALIDIDVEPYMGKASKINVTLPNLLTRKIDLAVENSKAYKSRSHFLQMAASHELQKHSAGS